jgi:hypothetical protein
LGYLIPLVLRHAFDGMPHALNVGGNLLERALGKFLSKHKPVPATALGTKIGSQPILVVETKPIFAAA